MLSGCSPAIVEEIAEGVTEGIIDEIEEYAEHGHKKRLKVRTDSMPFCFVQLNIGMLFSLKKLKGGVNSDG